jgi:hypothetical protein
MGNIALHELVAPKKDDLKVAIEVSKDLLNFLYELDYKATSLSRRLGARVSATVSQPIRIRHEDKSKDHRLHRDERGRLHCQA